MQVLRPVKVRLLVALPPARVPQRVQALLRRPELALRLAVCWRALATCSALALCMNLAPLALVLRLVVRLRVLETCSALVPCMRLALLNSEALELARRPAAALAGQAKL